MRQSNPLLIAVTGLLGLSSLAAAQDNANKLTAAETTAGYELLFNGTDLSNWHVYRGTTVPDAWTVKTNAPLGPRIENGNGNKRAILTNKKFKNFDLKIDVQTPIDGNSGIFLRYEENATSEANARSGPEVQVCGPQDSDCSQAIHSFGSCYEMFPVKESLRNTWYNPPGQWNSLRIIAYDSNYVHYGNGKKLLEYKIGTQEFIRAYNASKYVSDGNNGRYYHIHEGGILLQHHGEIGITFRNIKVKALTAHPLRSDFTNGLWPEELPQDAVLGSPVSIGAPAAPDAAAGISVDLAGAGTALVTVPAAHAGFSAVGIDGRAVPFRKVSEGVYSVGAPDLRPGLVVVRLRADAKIVTKLINIP